MSGWNLVEIADREYQLINGAQTLVTLSPSSKIDPVCAFSELEELGVPIGYARELREIRFTMLPNDLGRYVDNVIQISSKYEVRENVSKVLIHELGHHVDFMDDVVSHPEFDWEFRKKAKLMHDHYARKDSEEYLCVGFETFYSRNIQWRQEMRVNNPILYRTIEHLHIKFGDKKNGLTVI